MELAISIIVVSIISIFVGILWVNGINYMDKNHPDYTQIIMQHYKSPPNWRSNTFKSREGFRKNKKWHYLSR